MDYVDIQILSSFMLQSIIFSIFVKFYSLYAISLTIIFLLLLSEIYSKLIIKLKKWNLLYVLIRLSLLHK